MPWLEVRDLTVAYGNAIAVDSMFLSVNSGERVTLIGPNGAGKTSLLNAICGMESPVKGRVFIRGTEVTGWQAGRIVGEGVSQVPEGRQVFPSLSVEANLLLGAFGSRASGSLIRGVGRYVASKTRIQTQLERVYTLMPKLQAIRERTAGVLSGGEQQMVAIGRALMAEPSMLAIDELSLGLAPLVVEELLDFLRQLNEEHGVTILSVEQNARLALDFCETAYVLAAGSCTWHGSSSSLRSSGLLESAYLGGDPL